MYILRRLFRKFLYQAGRATVQTTYVEKRTEVGLIAERSSTTVTVNQTVISGKCWVIDGDTIVIGSQKIRLAGIDAPELQNPYGQQAKWAMVQLCKDQNITAYLTGETSFDRLVAKCFLDDGRDLAAEMVKLELALDVPHFPNADYSHLETPNARRKLRWRPKPKL